MGHWHAVSARRACATIAVVCDTDMTKATRLATQFSGVATTDIDHALDLCDVVHICTPRASHFALSMKALTTGRHVVCEKPITEEYDTTSTLISEASQRGLKLVPTHQFLFQDGTTRAQHALPTLGAVRHIEMVACTAGAVGRTPDATHRVALDILPHPLSLFERLAPGVLADCQWTFANGLPGEIRGIATARGMSLSILISCSGRPPINRMRLIAERGTIAADLFHGFATIDRGLPSRQQKIRQPFADALRPLLAATGNLARRAITSEWAYPGLRQLISLTYDAIIHGTDAPIPPSEVLAVARAYDHIKRACAASSFTRD